MRGQIDRDAFSLHVSQMVYEQRRQTNTHCRQVTGTCSQLHWVVWILKIVQEHNRLFLHTKRNKYNHCGNESQCLTLIGTPLYHLHDRTETM